MPFVASQVVGIIEVDVPENQHSFSSQDVERVGNVATIAAQRNYLPDQDQVADLPPRVLEWPNTSVVIADTDCLSGQLHDEVRLFVRRIVAARRVARRNA